jgi:phosphate-selective porin OprO and OprP
MLKVSQTNILKILNFMLKRLLFILSVIGLTSITAFSQTEVDERAMIRFDQGLGFHSPDSLFGLNLRFRMQNRIGIENTMGNGVFVDEVEARIRRLRLRIDGYTKNQHLTYYLQLSFSRDDQDWDNTRVPNVVRDAMVYYVFGPKFYVGFGQGKLPGNRQRINSSGQLQFADRSIANSVFNIDRDVGFMFYFSDNIGATVLNLKGAITTGEGRSTIKSDNGLAYTGRVELLPLGRFLYNGDFSEGDLERELKPKLALGAGYSFNHKAIKNAGQRGTLLFEQRDINTFFADALFKYMGWAWAAEFFYRSTENPLTFSNHPDPVYILTGNGFNTQGSYYFVNGWEVAARYSMINPSAELSGFEAGISDYTLGITKYLNDHKVKMQANFGFTSWLAIPEVKDARNSINARFQVELGI